MPSDAKSETNGAGIATVTPLETVAEPATAKNGSAPAESRAKPKSATAHAALTKWAKYILFGVNAVAALTGLILFIAGVVLLAKFAAYSNFVDKATTNIAVLCVVIGFVMCLIASLGLFGSIREDYCCLLSFSILLGIVIFAEFAMGVAGFAMANASRLTFSIEQDMIDSLQDYGQKDSEVVTKVWRIMQTDLRCCGVNFPGDWAMTPWARSDAGGRTHLPSTCCSSLPVDAVCTISSPDHHTVGCLNGLESSARKHAGVLGALCVIIGFFQIGLVLAAVRVMKKTKKPGTCPPFY